MNQQKMKTRKRRPVEPALDDPLSQRITALQMKVADLKVDHRRANALLVALIAQRAARQAIIAGAIQGINEAIAEGN